MIDRDWQERPGDAAPANGPAEEVVARRRLLPDPAVTYIGPVAVWWIPKPRSPRFSLRMAAILWLVGLPVLAATLLWVQADGGSIWPFGRRIHGPPEILLRYELIGLVCLAYVTMLSLPAWLRHRRYARRDVVAIDAAIQAERWERAALLLHRYCLLMSAVWRKVPARALAWDGVLRHRLPRHRRLYVYYRAQRPELPPDATAGFTATVISPPRPSLWAAGALVPVALMLYLLVMDIVRHGYPQRLVLFNALLLIAVLVSYGTFFLTALLGRSSYYRLAPGVLQLIRYRVMRHRPRIETYDLRRLHVVLDLSSNHPGVTLLDTPKYRRETLALPPGSEAIEALFRAVLSTVPSPPLPEDTLVD